ncbi:hypothetical protein [Natranaeroarchaeum sulfidigenes]|uniref:Transcriptional regulator containing HTH domain,ArsR family n=1 Tax=Natranaeroarchaeum sulfidigenes TaxID=2784880 RepID=A0A897MQW1_9EURY|nr:hypothetical protein [Natranaeroarchaeum sulfidigenes]QSG02812.1 Transcriptional regulator containing HTH domain,ArsR family [Natranaeroarchaeum sulfidigenes]
MSEGYILNALQTPGVLRPVYESVCRGNGTRLTVRHDTGLDRDAVQQATDGLRYVRLLGQEDGEYYAADIPWEIESDALEFRMAVLHNLAQECTPGDWGKQAVVLLNYQYLLEKDIQYFKNDDSVLYDSINEWHRNEKNYIPMSQQGEIDLNKNKFVNWTRIIAYLGLVHKASGREHTVYPDPDIVETSIQLAIEERGSNGRIEIEKYLDWLRKNLFPITRTSSGELPASLSRILYNLVRDGTISLVEYGDAGAVSLARTPRRDGIDAEANTIEVMSE